MKVLFITTSTNDVDGHVEAWNCCNQEPALWVKFEHRNLRNDGPMIQAARLEKPDVIFYIGACEARGLPARSTFKMLSAEAPLIHICCDAGDAPWHRVLHEYHDLGCFALQVGIDGCKDAPVDLATLTPVDVRLFGGRPPKRRIRCGFSGTIGYLNDMSDACRNDPRGSILIPLAVSKRIRVLRRSHMRSYRAHVAFIRRCKMLINTSYTGSGKFHHIKGRVLEAGWAGCALLESKGSPIADWLPEDCYLLYDGAKQAEEIIEGIDDATIRGYADRLARYVREHYHPRDIYREIMERAGLVDHTFAVSTAHHAPPCGGLPQDRDDDARAGAT